MTIFNALRRNFLGIAPGWYKLSIVAFLIINPILWYGFGGFVAGWALLAEFIYTLALALRCYPLQSGGLLALQATLMGMTTPKHIYEEVLLNFEVIFLLIFMVSGIFFMREFLLMVFSRLLVKVRSYHALALMFCLSAAFFSAFLDALTVMAVLISSFVGFYALYYKKFTGVDFHHRDYSAPIKPEFVGDVKQFRAFLRGMLMHAAVGTALGGVCTMVGEPQNLIIADRMNWEFGEFFWQMAPVTMPTLIAGLLCCAALQHFKRFGYGVPMPDSARKVFEDSMRQAEDASTPRERAMLWTQGAALVFLVFALGFHLAPIGLIGLSLLVGLSAFNGIVEERRLGRAFEESLPFTALLVVFFSIVAVINDQGLFKPMIDAVFSGESDRRVLLMFGMSGLLSVASDNVFVGATYMDSLMEASRQGLIAVGDELNKMAVAINAGTNLLSVATPNGQAAFLFLLTSLLASLTGLSYGRMIWMALPYTLTLAVASLLSVMMML